MNETVYSENVSVNWVCSDVDVGSLTAYFFVNGTFNGTSSDNSTFNISGLEYFVYYCVDMVCGDGSANMTDNSSVCFSTSNASLCSVVLTNPVDGMRYQDNTIPLSVSCVTGDASECYYSINDFANVSINCTSGNVSAELGWNRFTLFVVSSTGDINSTSISFWAKKYNSNILDYWIVWVFIAVYAVCMYLGGRMELGIVYLLGVIPSFLLGYELMSLSWMAGFFVAFTLTCVCVILAFTKR
jgi:hypothetical protein